MKRFLTLIVALALVMISTSAFAGEWTGKFEKSEDGKISFKSGETTLSVTNADKVTADWIGKDVKVVGTDDAAAKTLTIDTVSAAAPAAA